jgi:hypothetical protein
MHDMKVNFITSPQALHPRCNGCNYIILHDHYIPGKMLMVPLRTGTYRYNGTWQYMNLELAIVERTFTRKRILEKSGA